MDCADDERVCFVCDVELDCDVAKLGRERVIVRRETNDDSGDANDECEHANTNGRQSEWHDGAWMRGIWVKQGRGLQLW
jgi:hypothetical protein